MASAERKRFQIGRADRVFIVGTTGSGKTTLAKALLYGSPNVVILDPKRTFSLPANWEHTYYTEISDLDTHDKPSTAIYRPSIEEMDDRCDKFFNWLFERQNTLVYIDEVMPITNGSRIGKGYAKCLQLGREVGIGVWSATQRPANIPLVVMTESEHYFVFRLRNIEDRRRIYDYTGYPQFMQKPKHEFGFYYYNDRTDEIRYYSKARLGKGL